MTVEKVLPREFIYSVGKYVQTCAHIEMWACALINCLDGKLPDEEEWFESFCKLRKLSNVELTRKLASSASNAEVFGFSEELGILSEWIRQYTDNRHIAVHGAFFGTPKGFLRVDYLKKSGPRKSPTYEPVRTPITQNIVDTVCHDAERIHAILIGMIEKIQPGLTNRIIHVVLPVVEHPVVR